MTTKRFLKITKGRSYTIAPFLPNVDDTLRISKDWMIVFNKTKN